MYVATPTYLRVIWLQDVKFHTGSEEKIITVFLSQFLSWKQTDPLCARLSGTVKLFTGDGTKL